MSEHSSAQSLAVEAPETRFTQLWSVRVPLLLDPWAPQVADAFADGVWTMRWRRVASFGPLAAFAIGLLFPLLWPWMRDVYSESLLFLILIVAASLFSGPLGVMLYAGYMLGDSVNGSPGYSSGGLGAIRQLGGMVITWMLLAIPVVIIPQLGRRMSDEITTRLPEESALRLPARVTLHGGAAGLLVFLWCQAMIVLIRPVFTWAGSQPTTEAVMQVQTRWGWIAACAVVAAVARLLLEHRTRRLAGPSIALLEQERWSNPAKRAVHWRRMPLVVRVGAAAIVVALVLAGTYSSVLDAIVVFAVIAALKAWRAGLFGSLPQWWTAAIVKVPILVRFILAPLIGFVLASALLRIFWRFGSLRPVMAGALLTLVIFHLFFPVTKRRTAA